jgi:serine/threonine-protein kinase
MPIGISKSRWQEIQSALDEVLDKPEDERLKFLDKFAKDEQLYVELKKLIGHDLNRVSILDSPAAELLQMGELSASERDDPTPHSLHINNNTNNNKFPTIEKYQIEKEVGRGGMGRVYLARQVNDSFERRVAIKVLSTRNNDPQIIQRFEKEQRLLASLEHQSIAKIYDGGLTQEGTPYFVMEYIEGVSIDKYCDNNLLTIEQRLSLTLQIIDALDFAHKNLVVHRDIKPSNLLVATDGNVKLVDFGIAKLVNEEGDNQLTQTGNQILTPGFAAPEQLLDKPITTTTDIYLLGLVMYKLFTGHQAYQDLSGSIVEMIKVMCEESPTMPSLVNTSLKTPEDSELLRDRSISLKQLKSKLSGDLDAIVLKCLSNRPQDRYQSMSSLRNDIECYFTNRPISAQHATLVYQTKKYARRHWKGLSILVVSVFILASYAYTVTVQSKKIQSALELTKIEKNKAQHVSDFLLNIFMSADPNVASLSNMTAADLLDQGRQQVLADLQQAPEIQSHMLTSLGEVYFELGEADKSVELLEKSLSIQRKIKETSPITLADTLTNLGVAYVNGKKLDQAGALLKESLALHEKMITEQDGRINIEYAETHTVYGQLQRKLGNYQESIRWYKKSIELLNSIGANNHHEMAVTLNGLASVQQDLGMFEDAAKTMQQAIEVHEKTLGSEHSYFTIYLNNLSILLTSMERFDEAFGYSNRALEIQKRILPDNHRYFAGPLRALGKISHGKGQLDQALNYFTQALDIYRNKSSSNNYITAIINQRLGLVYQDMGEYEKAQMHYSNAFKIHNEISSGDKVVAKSYHLPAKLALLQSNFTLAETYYQKALQLLPDNGLHTSIAQLGYSQLLLETGDYKKAEVLIENAIRMFEKSLPKSHSLVAESQLTLGLIYRATGKTQHGNLLIEPAMNILQQKPIYQFGHRKRLLQKLSN